MRYLDLLRRGYRGMFVAVVIGIIAVFIRRFAEWPVLDPLLVALVIGIIIRSFVKADDKYLPGFILAPSLFIPIGVIFYGAVNLNFVKFATVDTNFIFMLFIVFIVYLISTILLSNVFGLSEKVSYLIASGSAICGASAITITSRAIDAEPDEISISLISVYISALVGLFVILPFLSINFKMSNVDYGVFSGTVLQFTGFVKAAVASFDDKVRAIALSVKAVRYTGLLFLIPLFASFVKGRFFIPWYLWAFLVAGLCFSFIPGLAETLGPACKSILTFLWSIAMAAIGLNANLKVLLTRKGLKALGVSFISFMIAVAVFLIGIKFI